MPSETEVAPRTLRRAASVDSTAVSIFVVILVELTNTVFVNSTNITTNFETAALCNSTYPVTNVRTTSAQI